MSDQPMTAENVDISKLSVLELNRLSSMISIARAKRAEEDKGSTTKAFFESPEVKAIKKKLDAFEKEFKGFKGKYAITVTLPVKFTLNMQGGYESIYDLVRYNYYGITKEDLFEIQFDGKLQKGGGLDKVQREYFSEAVADHANGACAEVVNLYPELRTSFDTFITKLNEVITQLHALIKKHNVDISVIDDLK